MQTLQRSLTSSVEAYNKVVGSFENRVLVTARRFPDLGVVGSGSAEIAELSPVDRTPRRLQAVELEDDEEYPEGTLLTLPEGGAGTGTPA